MQIGQGSISFDRYVRNLQQFNTSQSIGSQLVGDARIDRLRGVLVYNPYVATVADLGVYGFSNATVRKPTV